MYSKLEQIEKMNKKIVQINSEIELITRCHAILKEALLKTQEGTRKLVQLF